MKNLIKDRQSLRQRVRKALIIFSFVLLPVTFAYISCPIIKEGASEGIVTGGLIVFILLFISSLFLGRLWCGWLCPAGGLQEIYFPINDKIININNLKWFKYFTFLYIILIPLLSAIRSAGGLKTIDFFYYTDHGVSIANQGAYSIFWGQIFFITLLAMLAGRRGFCHYFCPIAVILIIGRKIRNLIRWPALHVSADAHRCTDCRKCSENCPMGLDVNIMVRQRSMENTDCILCGSCMDACPKQAIRYALTGKSNA
ncbi:MAG TPA: 4Fe-4S binding protein [Methanotrichaceae archaeon]|nr:4Fe-4S binding protein [Methanotrichaceae archaeon]